MNYEGLALPALRENLDKLDNEIILSLVERFKMTQAVGEFKKANNLPAFDESREDAIYSKLEAKAIEQGLDPEMLCGIWKLIIEEVKQNHDAIRQG